MKFERWLFSIFLFSIPLQTRVILAHWTSPFNEWTAGFLWGTDIIFALLIISNFQFPISKKSDIFLFLFLGIALVSITQAIIPAVAWYRFIKLFEYACVYFYFKHNRQPATALVLVASGTFQAVIGILQYARQADLGLRLLGESPLTVHASGVAVVAANAQSYLRAYGTFPHPNVLAAWLMLCLWACAWMYLDSRRWWLLASFSIMLVALFLTFSRVAIGMGGLASLILVVRQWRASRTLVIATAVVSVFFVAVFWPQVQSRLHVSAEDEVVVQRIFYTTIAGRSIAEHPWLGIGIGQSVPMLMKTIPHYPRFIYQPAHNVYLLIADELGIAGLIVFMVFLGIIVRRCWKTRPQLCVMLLAMLCLGFFDHFFWTLQQGGLILWGLLGVASYDIL